MTTATKPVPERLKELPDLEIHNGGHSSFREGHCAMELVAYLAGEPHSASPACTSPVLSSFLVRLNDSLPDDARQQLKPYLPKVIGTAGDGKDELRGWLATDWMIRTALPTWLELAGAEESAATLRALPQVTAETVGDTRPLVQKLRDEMRKRRQEARDGLYSKVYEAVKKKLKDKGAAAYAAYAAADAAYAAAAYAADAAAAAAYADRLSLRAAVRKAVREKVEEKLEPTKVAILPSALEPLDRMIDPVEAE